MDKRFVFYGSVLNLVTLLAGITIGFIVGTGRVPTVHAQETPPIEEIAPSFTGPSAAFGTLLASRAAIDNLSIQGLDVAKFDQNLINLLASKTIIFNTTDIQQVIAKSHSDKILRMKQLPQPTPPQGKKP